MPKKHLLKKFYKIWIKPQAYLFCHQIIMNILPNDVAEQQNNRTNSAPLISESIIIKQEKGYMDYINDGSVLFFRWKDNAVVTVGSNFEGIV
ncbi:hypothetical protein A3Q56_00988 [Intoshia linei]|uniref:PiggyBac transposable element-derived protein domain-containing protein n=1 Tax=Intoshia linei TaxID=1819745 RepID=A0A177BAM9_9BILA|nr:hypothetical protein A3Q56_00988 [Intoshia linei]